MNAVVTPIVWRMVPKTPIFDHFTIYWAQNRYLDIWNQLNMMNVDYVCQKFDTSCVGRIFQQEGGQCEGARRSNGGGWCPPSTVGRFFFFFFYIGVSK